MPTKALQTRHAGYLIAVVGIAAVTAALRLVGESINPTTGALVMLLVVLFVAASWGSRPAIVASVLGVLGLNFFFLPPVGTLAIADPDNWVALIVFLITAVTAGQLSANAKRRAEEAEAGRREIERLYDELRSAFERASHAEALRESERLKSALLDAVTHDIRTPLTSIKASATLLLEDREETEATTKLSAEEQHAMLKVISEESERLNHFVESIVDLARIEAGDIRLRRNWGPIEEIIDAAVARAESLLRQHQLRVIIEKELPVIRVDARGVAEVIYTLLDNASKYAQPNTLVTIQAERAGGDLVKISVEDQGPGIPHRLRKKVFEKFYRAHDSLGSGIQGSGLGLTLARQIARAHGGDVSYETRDGGGSCFCLRLPILLGEKTVEAGC